MARSEVVACAPVRTAPGTDHGSLTDVPAAEHGAVAIRMREDEERFVEDERNRPETSLESLAERKPARRKDGTITAGSGPGRNAGAAPVLPAERSRAERSGLEPAGRLAGGGIALRLEAM